MLSLALPPSAALALSSPGPASAPAAGANPSAASAASAAAQAPRPVPAAEIHPLALAQVLDSHLRRHHAHDRVFGTLLGLRRAPQAQGHSAPTAAAAALQVTESFAVPYAVRGQGQVTIDIEHHRAMLELYTRQNPRLVVVGWYATHPNLNSFSALIHQFYQHECLAGAHPSLHQAVHLALDPESLAWQCYTALPIGLSASASASASDAHLAFAPLDASVLVQPHERPSLDLLTSRLSSLSALVPAEGASDSNSNGTPAADGTAVPTALESLYALLRQVTAMLDQVLEYVRSVASGEVPGDEKVGRALLETVGNVPTRRSAAPAAAGAGAGARAEEEEEGAEGTEKKGAAARATGEPPAAAAAADFEEEFNAHLADVLMVSYLANVIKTQSELSSRLNLLV
ncbi:hypothetical protein JCM8202_002527 [Rhodotorula sphaerocarpa]